MPLERIADTTCLQMALKAGVGASLALLAHAALACGSNATQAAIQAAEKFALASKFCNENQAAIHAEPLVAAVKVTAPMAPSAHAQQLSMYDNLAASPGDMGKTVALAPLSTLSLAPKALRPVDRAAPYAASRPMGVSREAAARAIALVPEINRVAQAYQIDPLLLHAIAHVESRHNPAAVSHAGAMGLMQVMPATARRFGVTLPQSELRDPKISLEVCSAYLKTLQLRFDNNLTLVIAAYNAGEGAVEKYGRRVPPYKETQGYVRDVMAHYLLLVNVRDGSRQNARAAL